MSPSMSIILLHIVSLFKRSGFPPLHVRSFVSEINQTVTITSFRMPGCPLIVFTADNAFCPHVFDYEEVRPRVLEAFEASIMISDVAHTLSPVCNAVVGVLECLWAENADSLRRRTVIQEVGGGMRNIGIDLGGMEA